jgi:phosphoglycerate kinase
MTQFKTLDDLGDLTGKRVLLRTDLNVPRHNGVISDKTRIDATLPTIMELLAKNATVMILAHYDRPKGRCVPEMSLEFVTPVLAEATGRSVTFFPDCTDAAFITSRVQEGGLTLLENTRFEAGEEKNDVELAKIWAGMADIYVNDAFSAAHRAHASTEALAHLLPAYAGRSMQRELDALENALGNPVKPVVAIVGGAKVSSKLDVLTHLTSRVQHLIIGGGMANTFLAARGLNVGKSLCEHDLAETARNIMDNAAAAGCTIHLPYDVVVAEEFKANPATRILSVSEVADDDMILDAGPAAIEQFGDVLKICRTALWNGPLGAFETPPFETATFAVARTAAALTTSGSLLSVAGGGDTVSALNGAGVGDKFSFVSTAGGAFLEWMEGKELPGVQALTR